MIGASALLRRLIGMVRIGGTIGWEPVFNPKTANRAFDIPVRLPASLRRNCAD